LKKGIYIKNNRISSGDRKAVIGLSYPIFSYKGANYLKIKKEIFSYSVKIYAENIS
jgi:hypothetical protein